MPINQIPGAVRLRHAQVGEQSAIQTAVTATRKVPWGGVPAYNPNRTNPDIEVGYLDPVISPYAGAAEATWSAEGPITANDYQIILAAALMGGVTSSGGGTAKTWDFQVSSDTSDPFEIFTVEFGDDTEATDGMIYKGGVIDSLEETMPQDLGPWTFSADWVFAGAALGANITDSLNIDTSPVLFFGADTTFKMDATAGGIGTTLLTNTVHESSISISNNLDQKRFANGSNTRFQLAGYGRGAREIELSITMAKSAAAIAERATLDDDPVPNRFFDIGTFSTQTAQANTPYSYRRRGAFRLFEAEDVEIGGNAAIRFVYRAYYDSTLGYAYRATLVNTVTTLAPAVA
jgi:hypothetical protein